MNWTIYVLQNKYRRLRYVDDITKNVIANKTLGNHLNILNNANSDIFDNALSDDTQIFNSKTPEIGNGNTPLIVEKQTPNVCCIEHNQK